MKITEIRYGSDDEEELMWREKLGVWEKVVWEEEAGGSSAGEAVRDGAFPGGGAVGAEAGSGGDVVSCRGGSEVAGRGGVEVTGHSRVSSDFGGEVTGRSRASFDFRGEVTGRSGGFDFCGGGEEEEEEWEMVGGSNCGDAVRDEVLPGGGAVGEAMGGGDVTGRGGGGGGGWFDFGKRTLIGCGARFLFYPTLAANVARNKIQRNFNWWDRIDEHVVLGAVPFRNHVPRLNDLGVRAVVTLTEGFETLIPAPYYQKHGIEHLEIPTPDYSASPSTENILSALHFMHVHASKGNSIYVHCKAGRGRSTTVVLCYLMKYKNMTAQDAWNHTRAIRPRVSLTNAQKEAVTQFSKLLQSSSSSSMCESMVLVDDADLMGYKNGDADTDASSEEVRARGKPSSRRIQPDP